MRVITVLLVLAGLAALAPAQQIVIGEYPDYLGSGPNGITSGADGALWFTESSYNSVGRLSVSGVLSSYFYDRPCCSVPIDIATGADGNLWFTAQPAKLGKITTGGIFTFYGGCCSYALTGALPGGITAGPDGQLWFTDHSHNDIDSSSTSGAINRYGVPTSNAGLQWITAGPDGALWFTEAIANQIGRATTSAAFTEYPIPTANSKPNVIAAGPDGALWFTEIGANQVGRITTAGVVTEYPVPTANASLNGITAGPDGALWFVESAASQIGRITMAGVVTEYPTPTADSQPYNITLGPDGSLWFTEQKSSRIGQVVFTTASLSVSPSQAEYGRTLSFTGSGFDANESVTIYSSGVGSAVLATATADSSGTFTASAQAPASPYGKRIFLCVGQQSGKIGAAPFAATPRLFVSPNSGSGGTFAAVTGFGFGSGEGVKVYWNNPNLLLGTVGTDAQGAFYGSAQVMFRVPVAASPGANTIMGVGETTGKQVTVTFTVK